MKRAAKDLPQLQKECILDEVSNLFDYDTYKTWNKDKTSYHMRTV
jgi:hypothetical protein